MRPKKSGCQSCVAPIPKDARAGFDEVGGEFCAYPTGRGKSSWKPRASHIWRRSAGSAGHGWPRRPVSDAGAKRFSKTGRLGWDGGQRTPSARVQRVFRSLVSVFLRNVMASTARRERRLGIDPVPAFFRQRSAGDGSSVAREDGTREAPGSGPPSSPGSQAGRTRRGSSRWADT